MLSSNNHNETNKNIKVFIIFFFDIAAVVFLLCFRYGKKSYFIVDRDHFIMRKNIFRISMCYIESYSKLLLGHTRPFSGSRPKA